jgi:hypothetical protein
MLLLHKQFFGFNALQSPFGDRLGKIAGQKIITGIAFGDIHFVANSSQTFDIFPENELNRHRYQLLSGVSENESQNAGPLDGNRQELLVLEAVASDAARKNLATLGLKTTEQFHVLKVNVENLVFAKAAILLPHNFAATTRFLGFHGYILLSIFRV